MDESRKLTIAELAELAGVTPRTIRYYTTERILPKPSGSGKKQFYGREHEVRLRLAKVLREEGLPVSGVREQLARWTEQELEDALALADRMREHPLHPREILSLWEPGRFAPALPRALLRRRGMAREFTTLHAAQTDLEPGTYVGERPRAYEPTEEPWLRIRVTPQVEIQYSAAGSSRLQDAVRDIVAFARRRLAAKPGGQQ